jgi:hypothetical protein
LETKTVKQRKKIMATTAEVTTFLRNNFRIEEISTSVFKILVDLDNDRSQLVFVSVGDGLMIFTSPFASNEDITAKQALSAVQGKMFGLQDFGGFYCLAHSVFTEDLDASEILNAVGVLSFDADDLENRVIGGDTF